MEAPERAQASYNRDQDRRYPVHTSLRSPSRSRNVPCTASSTQPIVDSATQPIAYNTKIVVKAISNRRNQHNSQTESSLRNIHTQSHVLSGITSGLISRVTNQSTVSPTTASQPEHLKQVTHVLPLPESTPSDTVDDQLVKRKSHHLKMASSASQWEFECFPEDFWDHDPANNAFADPFDPIPHQLQYPLAPSYEQQQIVSLDTVTGEEEVDEAASALIDQAIDQSLEDIDLDVIEAILNEDDEEPFNEFFPLLHQPSTSMADELLTPVDPLLASYYRENSPEYAELAPCQSSSPGGSHAWVPFGNEDGTLDRSPTFMDSAINIGEYMQEMKYDFGDSSAGSPSDDSMPPPSQPRYAPYSRPAPSKPGKVQRQPVFRPKDYGTPLEDESHSEYRARRDKNNASSAASRRKRTEKINAMKEEAVLLEKRNIALKAQMESLEREVANCKELLKAAICA